MGVARPIFLAIAGVVLAATGVTLIVLAAAAQTPPPQPPSAAAERPVPVVSTVAEPDPAPQPPAVEEYAFTPPVASPPVPEKVDDPVHLPSSEPAVIDIPAIGVHSEMQQVGLTAEHTMEVPVPGPHYNDAAWYKHSATPGAIGPAVIIGHVDSAADGPSVFYDLGNLRPGDEVLVTRRDGTVAIFVVEAVRQYAKDDFPTELVYGGTDDSTLRLITCGGQFDRSERSYLDNVVVFATLVGSQQETPSSNPPRGAL